MKYTALSAAALGENVLNPNHSDPSRQTSSHNSSEQVTTKANAGEGIMKIRNVFVNVASTPQCRGAVLPFLWES